MTTNVPDALHIRPTCESELLSGSDPCPFCQTRQAEEIEHQQRLAELCASLPTLSQPAKAHIQWQPLIVWAALLLLDFTWRRATR